jgi:sterol desaturase/sphingolipid hydroxylase (fatty acid hydroxylase superfamily)
MSIATRHAVPALWRVHRVHHADLDFDVTTGARFHPIEILLSMLIADHETNSNFGFNLSLWDRLFRTYKLQPDAGHQGMTIGIRDHRDPKQVSDLPGMLALPFVGADGGYAINRRQWASTS